MRSLPLKLLESPDSPRDQPRTTHCLQDTWMLFGAWQAPDLHLGKHRLLCRDTPLQHSQLGNAEGLWWHGPAGSHRPKPLQQLLAINTHDLLTNEVWADAVLATDFLAGNPACSELFQHLYRNCWKQQSRPPGPLLFELTGVPNSNSVC